jgi:hypothetical protein
MTVLVLITQESLEAHKEIVKLTRQNDMNAKRAGPLDNCVFIHTVQQMFTK